MTRRHALSWMLGAIPAALLVAAVPRGRRVDWRAQRWRRVEAQVGAEAPGTYYVRMPSGAVYHTNESGMLLWRLCDARHTGGELVEALAAHGGIGSTRAERETELFLSAMVREGLVQTA